jgi:hypothetical protein
MGKVDMNFRYTSAEDSLKPNYLRNKFKAKQRELREQAERERLMAEAAAQEQVAKVRKIAK